MFKGFFKNSKSASNHDHPEFSTLHDYKDHHKKKRNVDLNLKLPSSKLPKKISFKLPFNLTELFKKLHFNPRNAKLNSRNISKIFATSVKNFAINHEVVGFSSIKNGINSLIVFCVIFLFWAIFIPIESASIADGTIILDFNRKTIQHLEGGIIDDILVKEGQDVKEGEVLLYLRDIKAKSDQTIVIKRLWTMKLQKDRLIAERDEKQALDFKSFFEEIGNFPSSDEKELQNIVSNQMQLFNARQGRLDGELKALQDKLNSVQAQISSSKKKLIIMRRELAIITPLVAEENLSILRQYEVEKTIADLEGLIAQLTSDAAAAHKQISNYKNEDRSKTIAELKETEIEIINLTNQLSSAKDVLDRAEIVAPTAGKIMNIKYHTVGAVIPPAGEIMSIVPQHDELIIEAKVKPQDIDEVRVGLKTKVLLTAYKGKKVPKLNGEVTNVSADIVINEQTRESYFLARVKIDKSEIMKLKNKVELYPGMPAQVFIITGARSLMSYLFTPIKDASYKAFREE
jgi:HlyD family secretion protein